MSENENNSPAGEQPAATQPLIRDPETQQQRWMKYGTNVAVMSIVAIALVCLLTYLAQAHDHRFDTTIGGAQSLSPQTVNIINDLKGKIRIVALYPKLKSESDQQDFYQPVVDLLGNFSNKNSNITTEIIDPDSEKDKFKKLVADVTNEYGGESKDYKAIIADYPALSDALTKFSQNEIKTLGDLPLDKVQDQDLQQNLYIIRLALLFSRDLTSLKQDVDSDMDQSVPSYKDAVDEIQDVFSRISRNLGGFSDFMDKVQSDPALPKEYKSYIPDALKRAAEAKKSADGILDRISHLGQLKELKEFRDQLKTRSIVVMGDGGYKIIQFEQMWTPAPKDPFGPSADDQHKYRFAGEQQISMAMAWLSSPTRQMVVFIRPAGMAPLSGAMGADSPLMYSAFAARLRDYNFQVMDKQAGESPEQQPPEMPEPTPEQMKSAIWVMLCFPSQNPMGMEMGGSPMEAMLAQHLQEGGSALVMMQPQCDAMASVFAPLGVITKPTYVLVHEPLPQPEHHTDDRAAMISRMAPLAFMLDQYGDHPLAEPLRDLDSLMYLASPVEIAQPLPSGVKVTPLLPIPTSPHSWATAKLPQNPSDKLVFNATDDLDNTPAKLLYGAAAIEKSGGERVVVLGDALFLTDQLLGWPDDKNPEVARLPGNGEFGIDSILWLAHRDRMLAISPHTLQMARIEPMSPVKLNFFRLGVLTAGLPALVIVAGLLVFLRRRD